MLGAYAAKQCPVKLFRKYDPTETAVAAVPDDALQQLFDGGISYESTVVERIVALHDPDQTVVIPGRDELDHDERRALTDEALAAGTPIILGALMQPDREHRRLGEIDVLLSTGRRVAASGRHEYRAIDIKSHRSTSTFQFRAVALAGPGRPPVHDLQLLDPQPVAEYEPRPREDDCLQLAHYHRLLQHLGHAEPDDPAAEITADAWGGIIGSEGVVAWFDLHQRQFATVTPQEAGDSITFHRRSHSTKRTALDRYDFEFAFRTRVVDAALRHTADAEPIVRPVKVKECERCDWRDVCDADLRAADDVSLVNGVGYPEWRVHRFVGVTTVRQLAEIDPDTIPDRYADTPLSPTQVLTQVRNAQSVAAGAPIIRDDWDPGSIPSGDIEIDLDMENDRYVYLWGARLTKVPAHWPEAAGTYRSFASFDPLDDVGEAALATDLLAWLDDLRTRAAREHRSLRIYSYSTVEATQLRRIVPSPELEELLGSEQWVDLFPMMKAKYWSNDGHGLKVMATAAGFEWRDDDPGGWASIGWYRDALAGVQRNANIERVLAYNEDDCRATAALR